MAASPAPRHRVNKPAVAFMVVVPALAASAFLLPWPPYALPGASTLPVSDYVSFFEFQAGLQHLAAQYPDYLTIHEVAQSVGLCPVPSGAATGETPCPVALQRFPIYMLELTNKKSPFPMENRQSMLFMLSIHGNEKGGREGGLRVIEDFALDLGLALRELLLSGIQPGAAACASTLRRVRDAPRPSRPAPSNSSHRTASGSGSASTSAERKQK